MGLLNKNLIKARRHSEPFGEESQAKIFRVAQHDTLKLRKCGFTLAEVLITLGIIGVVAAFTIPSLLSNFQDTQYKSAYKKVFSAANQALTNANQQSLINSTTAGDTVNNPANFIAFMDQFKVTKKCTSSNNSQCWDSSGEKFDGSYPHSDSHAFIDASGVAWSMYWSGNRTLFVDTNGFNKPNQWGKDRFTFSLTSATNSTSDDVPVKITVYPDYTSTSGNNTTNIYMCNGNKCGTDKNYYGTSWLLN